MELLASKDFIGVRVGTLIINNNKVLLLNRRNEPEKDYWTILGGAVLFGEKIEDAIAREVFEELNTKIEILSVQGVVNHIIQEKSTHWVSIEFLAELIGNDVINNEPNCHSKIQ
jgi:ADP-ribose pyrophosphatase YjhB (NUDIX family)